MTVSIEKLDKVKAELTITVPVEKFEEAYNTLGEDDEDEERKASYRRTI